MTETKQYYFAYGSNMSKGQMRKRTGSLPDSSLGRLVGYRFAFRKLSQSDECYADIIPVGSQNCVHGVIYNCSEYALSQLDIFEGVSEGCYRREMVEVFDQCKGELVAAIAYIGDIGFSATEGKPSDEYLNRIITGASEHGVPQEYIDSIWKCSGLAKPV